MDNLNTAELAQSYRDAIEIMKTHASTFYYAFSNLPKERFQATAAVYAFCRYIDDLVDYPKASIQDIQNQLAFLEQAVYTSDSLMDSWQDHPKWWLAFKDAMNRFEIDPKYFVQQIEGQRIDLTFKGMDNMEELIFYSDLVAGSVGLMLAPILKEDHISAQDTDFLDSCRNLGIGMQITNILRDVGEDIRNRNRIYLPKDLLRHYNISDEQLYILAQSKKPEIPPPFIDLWEELAQHSSDYYADFEKNIACFHPSCRLSILLAARVYHAIEDTIRSFGYDCFSKRCYVSENLRQVLTIGAKKFLQLRRL